MDFIIKKGEELFHSTGEPFEDSNLDVGGFDKVLWTAKESAISQAYIPKAGTTMYTTSHNMWYPSDDPVLQEFQRKWLGFEYDDIKVEGGRVTSWRGIKLPIKWDNLNFDRNMNALVNQVLTSHPFNYQPDRTDSYDGNNHWKLLMGPNREIMPSDYSLKGRLFILVPQRSLKLFDMTHGGQVDGDLNDRDYYRLDLFRELESKGYDGVRINDHAQTQEFGNFGHISYGLFRHTIKDLKKEVVHNAQHPMNLSTMYHSEKRDWHSNEYKQHRGLSEMISEILKREFFRP